MLYFLGTQTSSIYLNNTNQMTLQLTILWGLSLKCHSDCTETISILKEDFILFLKCVLCNVYTCILFL